MSISLQAFLAAASAVPWSTVPASAEEVLKLAVPEGASAAQQAVIGRVTAAAAQKGVQVVVVTVK